MKKSGIKSNILLLFYSCALFFCSPAFALSAYDGIWSGEFPIGFVRYFSLTSNNGRFLLVDLYEVGYYGNAPQGSYVGDYVSENGSTLLPSPPFGVVVSTVDPSPGGRVYTMYKLSFTSGTSLMIGRVGAPTANALPPYTLNKLF